MLKMRGITFKSGAWMRVVLQWRVQVRPLLMRLTVAVRSKSTALQIKVRSFWYIEVTEIMKF